MLHYASWVYISHVKTKKTRACIILHHAPWVYVTLCIMSIYLSRKNKKTILCILLQYEFAHGADHTDNIWISRSYGFPTRSFECLGLRLLMWNFVWKFGDFPKNVFDMYGDSRENSFEMLEVGIILSPISSVCGYVTLCIMSIPVCISHVYLLHVCIILHHVYI